MSGFNFGSILGAASGGPLGVGIGAAGLLGGLLAPRANYSQANQYQGQANTALGQENALGSQYGQLGSQALGSYNNYNSQYKGAVNDEANYLRQDPFTDQRSAMDLSRATQGTAGAYQQARSQLSSQMGQRGMDPNSSMMAGGLASLDASQANTLGQAQNTEAYNQIGQRQANMGSLTSLLGGTASGYYGQGAQAMGAQAGIAQNVAGMDSGMADYQASRSDAYNQGLNGLVGSSAQMIGRPYGFGAYPGTGQTPGAAPQGGGAGLQGGGDGYGGFGTSYSLPGLMSGNGTGFLPMGGGFGNGGAGGTGLNFGLPPNSYGVPQNTFGGLNGAQFQG